MTRVGACVALLALGACASSSFEEVLTVDCKGNLHGLTSHEMETSLALPSSLLPQVYDWFVDGLRDRASCVCPSLSDADLDSLFLLTVGNVLQALPGTADLVELPADCKASFSMNDLAEVTSVPLPSTCTYQKWQAGEPCNLAWEHETLGVDLQLAVDHCPDSHWPFVSLSCAGASCKDLFRPCRSDADCESGNACKSLRYYYETTEWVSGDIDHDNGRCTPSTRYDSYRFEDLGEDARDGWWDLMESASVVEADQTCSDWSRDPKDELLQYVLDAVSAIQGGMADEMKFCSLDKVHLAYDDGAVVEPTAPAQQWLDCNTTSGNPGNCWEMCMSSVSSSARASAGLNLVSLVAALVSAVFLVKDRRSLALALVLVAGVYSLPVASASWADMYFSDMYWPSELGPTCETIDSFSAFHNCYTGEEFTDCGATFPGGCCCGVPDVDANTCTAENSCPGTCYGPPSMVVEKDTYHCEDSPFKAWDGMLPSGQSASANARKTGEAFKRFASEEYTFPTETVSLLYLTCDTQLTILGDSGIGLEAVSGGETFLLSKMTDMLQEMHDCRYSTPLSEQEQLLNFHAHTVDFWMNVFLKTLSDAQSVLPSDQSATPLRELLNRTAEWDWEAPNVPSSCSLETWQSTGECKVQFDGFGEVLGSELNTRLQIRDCGAGRLPEVAVDCEGKDCEALFHVHRMTHCLDDSQCEGACIIPDVEDAFANMLLDSSEYYEGRRVTLAVANDDVTSAGVAADLHKAIRYDMFQSVDGLAGDGVQDMVEVEELSEPISTHTMWNVAVSFAVPEERPFVSVDNIYYSMQTALSYEVYTGNPSEALAIDGATPASVYSLDEVAATDPGQSVTASMTLDVHLRSLDQYVDEWNVQQTIRNSVQNSVGTSSLPVVTMNAVMSGIVTATVFVVPNPNYPAVRGDSVDCEGVDRTQHVLCGCEASNTCSGSVWQLSSLLDTLADQGTLANSYPSGVSDNYDYEEMFFCEGTGFQKDQCPHACRNDNKFSLELINLGMGVTGQPKWNLDPNIAHGFCEPTFVPRLDTDIDAEEWAAKYFETATGATTVNHLKALTADVIPATRIAPTQPDVHITAVPVTLTFDQVPADVESLKLELVDTIATATGVHESRISFTSTATNSNGGFTVEMLIHPPASSGSTSADSSALDVAAWLEDNSSMQLDSFPQQPAVVVTQHAPIAVDPIVPNPDGSIPTPSGPKASAAVVSLPSTAAVLLVVAACMA